MLKVKNIFVISNGHGEDIIAVKICRQLQQLLPAFTITALPMVGQGFAYQKAKIPIVTEVRTMPSGGFIYMDQKQFWRDLRSGLMGLTIKQLKSIMEVDKQETIVLAIGDILPLLGAWLSKANFFFVGTAKSEYYLRDEDGWLENTSWLERYWGSYYYPWECWLMKNRRCQGVFPRDSITHSTLQNLGVQSYDLGNPMMDDLSDQFSSLLPHKDLQLLLLSGSRMPEAIENWQLILQGVDSIIEDYSPKFICAGAIAPSLSLEKFKQLLLNSDWQRQAPENFEIKLNDPHIMYFKKKQAQLILSQNHYTQLLNYCNISLAMAGTATEQFVGLGKPAIAFPGRGPQYNGQFARNQKKLLGISLKLLDKPQQVGQTLTNLLSDISQRSKICLNGQQRLGQAGASLSIAKLITQKITKFKSQGK